MEEKERTAKKLGADCASVEQRFSNLNTELEVIRKDKSFLSDKNAQLLSELRVLKDENINLENKLLDLKNSKKKLKADLA